LKLLLVFIISCLVGVFSGLLYGAHWAFYLYEVIYFFHPENRWWGESLPSIGYSKLTVLFMIFSYFIHHKKYENKIKDIPVLSWFITLLLLMGIASFYAIWKDLHQTALLEFYKMFIILTVAYKVLDSSSRLQGAVLAYLFGATYIGYEAFVTGRNSGDRVEGIGLIDATDANLLAATLVPAIPLLIFYFWFTAGWFRIAIVISGAFIVNALILINSRGAMLGAAAGIAYFFFYYLTSSVKTLHHYKKLFLISTLGIIALLIVIDLSFIERMLTMVNSEDKEASGSGRFDLWLITFDMVKEYPFGGGAKAFNALSPIYVPEEMLSGGYRSVHSLWFQVLAELGWLGLFVFLMLIYKVYRSTRNVIKESVSNDYQFYFSVALLAGFIGLILTSSFIDQFRNQIIYIILLFLISLYSIVIRKESIKPFKLAELK
jgi:hypothetical protein